MRFPRRGPVHTLPPRRPGLWVGSAAASGGVPSGAFARYRASSLTLSDSDPVSTWDDEGSGGNDLEQATGADQPTYEAAGFNGHASVLFDGTDHWMQTAAYTSPLSQPNTVVVMGELVTNPTSSPYMFDGLVDGRNAFFFSSALATWRMHAGANADTTWTAPTAGTDLCVVAIFDGADSALHVNDGSDLQANNPGTEDLDGFTLGSIYLGTPPGINMRMVEVLIYDRALTASEITQLQDYFVETYTPIPEGPFAQYRASSLTLSDSDPVSTWDDEGSGGNDLEQATGADQPTYEAAGFNGHASVLFDGADHWMQTAAYASSLSQPHTVVVMGELASVDLTGSRYVHDGSGASNRGALTAEGSISGDVFRQNAGTGSNTTETFADKAGVDACLVSVFNGASSEFHFNDGSDQQSGNLGSNSIGAFTLMNVYSGTATPAHMRIVEVLIYDRALTASEITQLQNYFVATYTPIPESPFARYLASSLALSDTDPVSTWADEQSGGNDLEQATGADQPIYEAAGFNGHASVLFDGSSDYMQTAAFTALSQPNTIVVMGEYVSDSTGADQYAFDGAISSNRHALFEDDSAPGDLWVLYAGASVEQVSDSPVAGENVCLVSVFDGGSSALHVNDGGALTVGSSPGTDGLRGLTLAARFDGTLPANVRVVEALIYDRALTASEITQLQNYFTTAYAPPTVPDSPFARYRASSLALSDTDPVTTWPNEGTDSTALTQGSTSRQPVYEAAGFNGHPSVLFDGSDDYMSSDTNFSAESQPNTVVVMGEYVSVDGTSDAGIFDGVGTFNRHAVFHDASEVGDPWVMFAGSSAEASDTPVGKAGDDLCIVAIFDGASSEMHVNDGGDIQANSPGTVSFTGIRLGTNVSATAMANFRYVEVLFYTRALTASEITRLQDYFAAVYG